MIIVSSIALATMLVTIFLFHMVLLSSYYNSPEKNRKRIVNSRKVGIFLLIIWLCHIPYFCLDYFSFDWLGFFL
jgi:hypothetical protein